MVVGLPGQSIVIADKSAPQTTSSCNRCGGDGWLIKEIDGARKAYPCSCQRSSRVAHRIPAKYAEARLCDFKAGTIAAVGDWLQDKKSPGLYLYGPTGTGKTHLAVAICRALIESGQDVLLRSAARFFRELRDSYNTERTESAVMHEYVSAQWLLFDDLGAGSLSDHERRFTLDLLDQRQDRRTIVTTNLTLNEISEKLDERLSSRLAEFTSLKFAGADRRVKGGV